MATKGEIRLAARRGIANARSIQDLCLPIRQEDGSEFSLPISPSEYLQIRDKGEMDVIVNVRVIPKRRETK